MAEDPGGKPRHFQEPGIVRTKTGRIVAAIRNHGEDNAIWTTWPDNDGNTWTPVKQSPMIGHPADLTQLVDAPRTVHAMISPDSWTWDKPKRIVLADDAPTGDCVPQLG